MVSMVSSATPITWTLIFESKILSDGEGALGVSRPPRPGAGQHR